MSKYNRINNKGKDASSLLSEEDINNYKASFRKNTRKGITRLVRYRNKPTPLYKVPWIWVIIFLPVMVIIIIWPVYMYAANRDLVNAQILKEQNDSLFNISVVMLGLTLSTSALLINVRSTPKLRSLVLTPRWACIEYSTFLSMVFYAITGYLALCEKLIKIKPSIFLHGIHALMFFIGFTYSVLLLLGIRKAFRYL